MHRQFRLFPALSVLALTLLTACGRPAPLFILPAANTHPVLPGAPAGPPTAIEDLDQEPTTYTTPQLNIGIPWTYTGRQAQVLHHLFGRFPGGASTYANHINAAGGPSADLWTTGATLGVDNRAMASMDALAQYILNNMEALGIRYMVWEQIEYVGTNSRLMDPGRDLTANHWDHIHITWHDTVVQRRDDGPVVPGAVRGLVVVIRARRTQQEVV